MNANFEELKERINQKPLVLFVGAGINHNVVPKWKELLDDMFLYSIHRIDLDISPDELLKITDHTSTQNVYFQATFVKKMLGSEYLQYLQDVVYSKYLRKKEEVFKEYKLKNRKRQEYETLYTTADLCQRDFVFAVVNYNYDNILTQLINLKKKDFAEDVYHYQNEKEYSNRKLLIYHVHGFIPPPDQILNEAPENIVLSYDEYFYNMMEPYSWQTTTQLHFLMNFTCLFIGTSLTDWNMLRMLTLAKKYSPGSKHFLITKKELDNKYSEKTKQIVNKIRTTVLDDVGVKIIYTDNYSELQTKLKLLNPSNGN